MSFSNIYGHSKQIAMLQRAMAQGRLGHSYLFSGIVAIGKKTLALELAKALTCRRTDRVFDACDTCASCRKVTSGNHPDIHLIETQSQFIRIEAIRFIQDQMTFAPMEGGRRVFLLDDADRMNEPAANALLKTLEEPSSGNILILITSRPYFLPQTIQSRCRHLRFNPLSHDALTRFLVEKRRIPPERASLLASLSGGSVGQALEINTDETMTFRDSLMRHFSAAGRKDRLAPLALVSFLGQDKKDIGRGLKILRSFFRDALVYRETGRSDLVGNKDILTFIADLGAHLTGEELLQNIAWIEKSNEAIEMNVNKSLTLEAMAFKLHY
jgi:DNA polymerase-3 subunit delta'